MKRVVDMGELLGADIRPAPLLAEFRDLSVRDARFYFGDPADLTEVDCPACASPRKRPAYKKNGFLYNQCSACKSVFVSPRPTAERLKDYYQTSQAGRCRAERFSHETEEARRIPLLQSHANWLGRLFDEAGNTEAPTYADIGTNFRLTAACLNHIRYNG